MYRVLVNVCVWANHTERKTKRVIVSVNVSRKEIAG